MSRRYRICKRLMDICIASTLTVVTAPFCAVVAAVIRLEDRGPALYRAKRAGFRGETFVMFKFRTMVPDADRIGASSTPNDDPRITRSGSLLRRFKLDEVPQLWNVVRGDMSLVGPRPQVLWDVERYTPGERRLLDMRPGITDWASIRFRNEGSILEGHSDPDGAYDELIRPEKIALGLAYVDQASLVTDLKILLTTLRLLMPGQRAERRGRSPVETPDLSRIPRR